MPNGQSHGCLRQRGRLAEQHQAGLIHWKLLGVEDIVVDCTTSDISEGFVDMPGMTRDFTLGGSTSEEVVVMFQAVSSLAPGPEPGPRLCPATDRWRGAGPRESDPFISSGDALNRAEARNFSWQSTPLAPGSHTALIQFRTDSGWQFCVNARSLIILHR